MNNSNFVAAGRWHRVAFIRVDMHFELARRRQADEQVFQDRGAIALDPQVQTVAVLDAVLRGVRWAHVNVPFVTDDAAFQADHAGGTEQVRTGRIAVVAALAHRDVQAEHARLGKRQLDLAVIAARAEDAKVGDHPLAWTEQRHRLLRREEAVLVQRLVGRQLVAEAEKAFEIGLRDVAVPGRHVHEELRLGRGLRGRVAVARRNVQRFADHPLNQGAVQDHRGHALNP